ncbi:hypothetical protein [Janibacter sp. G1551]|uniref:hypothetical protein n=1 Tax=Janibacter sp. G1551 TaxID=3420440 RepID=UPI003D07F930
MTQSCSATPEDLAQGEVPVACAAGAQCQTASGESANLMQVYRRPAGGSGEWVSAGMQCGTAPPAQTGAGPDTVVPPPTPSMGQIREAFVRLPFSKPTVKVQPSRGWTLVNLPTYFEATWPGDAGLEPGEVSEPQQLLSWSVEFRVAERSYDYQFGDGSSSGPLSSRGGPYPEGDVRHTYVKPVDAVEVFVETSLTGEFRVNGGAWRDIATVANLENEPVTTFAVREARPHLTK